MEKNREFVVLVDKKNKKIGLEEKLKAHKEGKLHRALSVFVINSKNELLLQQRAQSKYHSGGKWANTCCSHPKDGEDIVAAAHRRLQEEMGIDCYLDNIFNFIYRAKLENGLIEYEYDHVFLGQSDETPNPNPDEVQDWKWMRIDDLIEDMKKHPSSYVYWLKASIERVNKHICNNLY